MSKKNSRDAVKLEEQKTIKKDFFLKGKGLQTGKPVMVFFYPAKEGAGISFTRRDLAGKPSARLPELSKLDADRRSKIGFGGGYLVETVEHVLAALWGAGIDNIRIELDGPEFPALDGSSLLFLEALEKAGIKKQGVKREFIEIKEPLWAEKEGSFLGIFPSGVFKIAYILEYPGTTLERQFFSEILAPEIFREKIAPARTFCLKEEAETLIKKGYGKGADCKNTLVMSEKGPVDNVLRFPDEPVRHKVLDLIGDLYLLGRPIKGRIVAIRSGHKLNLELARKIKESL